MKGIVLASNCSGGGKTTTTLGIMKALMKKGYDVQGYKVGPDYIDSAFHKHITKKPSRNLDLFLMGEEGVKASFSRGTGDVAIVEGVMGLYDGKGINSEFSTAHVAKVLDLPIILILSPKAQSATLAAEIQGILNYKDEFIKNTNIKGVILNNIAPGYYNLLKTIIETHCKIKVYGYIPKDKELTLESRHLGLVQCSETDDIDYKIDKCSNHILENININSLMADLKQCDTYDDKYHVKNRNFNIAVAKDEAFSFYYRENLELLQECGNIIYFSPLKDKILPQNIDFLYIGGGYPEVFGKELCDNITMRNSIKDALEKGLKCYAECGGLMYLTEGIEDLNGNYYEMVGFFKGKTEMTTRLQNFGYCTNEIDGLKKSINGHEFHKSKVSLNEKTVYNVTKSGFDGKIKKWTCGYLKKNTLAGYCHTHFFSNMDFLNFLMENDN
ncbi:cobyrinate a,c-diamide synthase [Clostridium senegalense]|uniref:Cobyrinate a,c-diamide synthase n=1 Tax=Clostridium senegalense TaxID=1465809 RepID=A0A6M0H368_9CLOT|nr:cobyrinate a,c-diamide synthase [Clostridium senegalense]NEU05165.1 cobyrinate a,c-diamide synthase [Clostridium senegalense]